MIGYITGFDGDSLTIKVPFADPARLQRQGITQAEIRLDDGRTISAEQRRKAWALIGEISRWSGHLPEEVNAWMKYYFTLEKDMPYISLSDCSMSLARQYIDYMILFCLQNDIPCRDRLIDMAEDVNAYLYGCLMNRRCAICGRRAELHHAEGSRVGMGRNRLEIPHIGLEAYALCRKHHTEAHQMPQYEFNAKHHLFPIKINHDIAQVYALKEEA